ncbi:unnamed protein product [Coregonus sp. 'balchen']|uniref:HIN-200 domain-containing protein n=1 Tax=Coregonus suidteri TaxID=861788 RepID=A0AAN8LXE2_9TELE|nr:uncharacterized protein LOC121579812 [Coregonus clupeaformis]CAB1316381.1 unnamed protein product [Coregonus sp. 'balchen']
MTSCIEDKWCQALTKIIEELDEDQYKKMCHLLNKIPNGVKSDIKPVDMPKTIISHLGMNKSILEMGRVMGKIPRNDSAIQDLLRPFVQNLLNGKQQKEKKGRQKNRKIDSESEETPAATGQKRKYVSDSEDEESEKGPENKVQGENNKGNPPPSSKRKSNSWMLTIADLKNLGGLGDKAIKGKIVKKSDLIYYDTKAKKKQSLFHMSLTDDTASIKVTVYGKERYDLFQEGSFYLLKALIVEGDIVKVTQKSKVSKTSPLEVPQRLEMEARMLIEPAHHPFCSIADAKASHPGIQMSIDGTVIDMTLLSKVKVKRERTRKLVERRSLTLQDETGSIEVCLWREQACNCNVLVGDTVRVTNVYPSEYLDSISLNSTGRTRIYKVQPATLETVRLSIEAIEKCTKMEVTLEAETDGKLRTFIVASEILVQTYGIKLQGDFEKRLLKIMPLSAEAKIQGNRITSLTKI